MISDVEWAGFKLCVNKKNLIDFGLKHRPPRVFDYFHQTMSAIKFQLNKRKKFMSHQTPIDMTKLNEQTAMSAQLMNQNNAQSLFTPYIIMCGNTDITWKWYQSKDIRHLWNILKMKPGFFKFSDFLFIFHIYNYFTKEGHCSSNVNFRKRFHKEKWRKTQTKSSFTRIREIWAKNSLFYINAYFGRHFVCSINFCGKEFQRSIVGIVIKTSFRFHFKFKLAIGTRAFLFNFIKV